MEKEKNNYNGAMLLPKKNESEKFKCMTCSGL